VRIAASAQYFSCNYFSAAEGDVMSGPECTVREAVETSGLSRQQVYNLLVNGRIAARKFGHVYIIDRKSLLDYLRRPRRQKKA
jgi:excisionase family DNA binding protein